MIYTATMWTLPETAHETGMPEPWQRTIMRGAAVDAEDFKRLCIAQQAPGTVVAFGPVSERRTA